MLATAPPPSDTFHHRPEPSTTITPHADGASSRSEPLSSLKAQTKSAVSLVNERRLDFVPARKAANASLNTSSKAPRASETKNVEVSSKADALEDKVERFLAWQKPHRIGPGLSNMGNTCYLNSTLQCLLYTPPLAQYLLHTSPSANAQKFSFLRAMAKLVQTVHGSNKVKGAHHSIQPREFTKNVRLLSKRFHIGRQEDAHEFFRLLLDHFDGNVSKKKSKKTIVDAIFGGTLTSSLTCEHCTYVSKTEDACWDMSLEIGSQITTLHQALAHYSAIEKLDAANAWKCGGCKRPSRAKKQLQMTSHPNVLVCQLKRFDSFFGKIKKHIAFPLVLDMAKYMPKGRKRTKYQLSAVLVHAGFSTNSGHYYAFVQGASGQWYEMNDDSVRWVKPETVLQQKAYMLFYTRLPAPKEKVAPTPAKESVSTVQKESVPIKEKKEEVGEKRTRDMDMNAYLGSLRTQVPSTSVETFHVQTEKTNKRARKTYAPVFSGRFNRFQPTKWTVFEMNMTSKQSKPEVVPTSDVKDTLVKSTQMDKWGENDMSRQHDAIHQNLKREERQRRKAGEQDFWNATLDAGKVKKVKEKKAFIPNQGKKNAFLQASKRKQKRR